MTELEKSKFLSRYDGYCLEMKLSACRSAFQLHNIPPKEEFFVLARANGYKIPDKWKDLYS
jgi:hypothetical protein